MLRLNQPTSMKSANGMVIKCHVSRDSATRDADSVSHERDLNITLDVAQQPTSDRSAINYCVCVQHPVTAQGNKQKLSRWRNWGRIQEQCNPDSQQTRDCGHQLHNPHQHINTTSAVSDSYGAVYFVGDHGKHRNAKQYNLGVTSF